MNICYIGGAGRLGSALAAWTAYKGHSVCIADVNEEAIQAIGQRQWESLEPRVAKMINDPAVNIYATTDIKEAVSRADMVFVIVPTSSNDDGSFSLEYMLKACVEIGRGIGCNGGEFPVVVIVSTVNPGDSMGHIKKTLEDYSGSVCGPSEGCRAFGLGYSPEFVAQGSIVRDFANPDVLLLGADDSRTMIAMVNFYASVLNSVGFVHKMSTINAEIAKLSLNVAVVSKIAVANQITWLCHQKPGADAKTVLAAVGDDSRIGRKYFSPGLWSSGPCFPRDTAAFHRSFDSMPGGALAVAVDSYNRIIQPGELAIAIMEKVLHIHKPTICIAGVTYKPGVAMTDESPGFLLMERLHRKCDAATVTMYDPLMANLPEVLEEADLVVVMLPSGLDELARHKLRTVFDCWGNYEGKLNCQYYFRLGRGKNV